MLQSIFTKIKEWFSPKKQLRIEDLVPQPQTLVVEEPVVETKPVAKKPAVIAKAAPRKRKPKKKAE